MNEIELLQSFREDVPDPDAATIRAVRAVLTERIETSPGGMSYLKPRSRRRLAFGLTAATATVVGVALILSIMLPRGGNSAAAADLRRFAAVAAHQPAPQPLSPGEYFYLREEGLDRIVIVPREKEQWTYMAQFTLVREYWVAADGSGRLVDAPGARLIWPSPRDKARGEADQHDSVHRLVGPTDDTLGPGEFVQPYFGGGHLWTLPAGYDFETLPRAPEALYEVIRIAAAEAEPRAPGSGPPAPTPEGTFGVCTALLHNPLTPPDVRAALFKAMVYIPGLTVVPEKTISGLGTGAAVYREVVMGGVRIRQEFLVDPATSGLLGYQESQLDSAWWVGADPPFVATSIAYARPRVVDSTTQRP